MRKLKSRVAETSVGVKCDSRGKNKSGLDLALVPDSRLQPHDEYLIKDFLSTLSKEQKKVVEHRLEGKKTQEICAAMRLNRRLVDSHLANARNACENYIRE